ncbi:lipoprotein [Spiroplasma cantharicola]|uniref:Lipoprotein n=1 Tax=Spiroplasma cantharicola TaxID=362837 RepID=A0A0M4JSV9_9MOLU|nr:lipoprotein [Spiroplasma cantharicola]ALD66710.1 hypothetical protein SCANT_v1c08040 [Spiroplasma cantharicola]
MKRLLGILSAVSLTVSTPSLVVACGTKERITSPKLNKELAKKLLVQISGNKDLANIDFGSLFTDAQIETVIVNMVNELLSLQYSFDSTNNMFRNLDFKEFYTSDKETGIEEAFKTKYSLESRTIAENKLFEDYTKSIGTTRLDYWAIRNNYNLNIQNNETKVNDINSEQIELSNENPYIYISESAPTDENSIWKFSNEQGKEGPIGGTSKLPQIEDLTKEYQENGSSMFWVKNNDGEFKQISAKTALYLRFQDYFESKLLEDINDNLLTNSYLKSTMFDTKTFGDNQKAPFINPSSAMFSKTQTLNETSINEYWKSNVKMVWTLKFDITKAEAITNINKVINDKKDLLNISSGALIKGKSIKDIVGIFNGTEKPIKDNKTAYDSYFGLQGFQGLTIYDGENAIGESPIAGKAYESKVKSWNNGPGIIKSSSENFLTIDSENNNYADLVIVLPIYMIELLGGSGTVDGSNEDANEDPTYKIVGKGKDEESKIKFSNTIGNDSIYKERWNNKNNSTLHSKDVAELAQNSEKQNALLNQIMYGISKDATSSELAKTIIYTKYLDKDDVYYAGLWDKIGTYIKSEDDKDE